MPEKKTKSGRAYKVDSKTFTWDTDDRFEESFEVKIPLRIKVKLLREFNDRDLDVDTRVEMLSRIIPDQADKFDDMDGSDFVAMFDAWWEEWQQLTGATPGE